ncbi:alpha/beta fold hydrolase [Microbacterium sp. 179-I 3D2 NHS]|uniref:alpha/beta fold hydrolase n=1 Tax=Microbacterium sp. 179-I 3D2 NHS TaxID=3235178 RepID=UPI0039A3078D
MTARRAYADVAHGQIHVVTAGDSGPWVVLLHESPLSWRVYEPAIEPLAQHFRVMLPDTPGYGGSTPGERSWEVPDYAAALLVAVRQTVGDEPFIVLGCHTGASIALEVARQAEGQARGAVFLGLPAYDPETRADRLAHWAPDKAVSPDGSHLADMWDRYTRIWDAPPLAAKNRAVLDALGALEHYNWGYNAAFRYDPVPALVALGIPVLFLTAEHDALADADRRCAEMIGARLVELPGLPGQIGVRAPQRLADELRTFATTLDA